MIMKITEKKSLPYRKYVYTLDSTSIFHSDWTRYINWCLKEFDQNIDYYIVNDLHKNSFAYSTLNIGFSSEEDLAWFLLNRTNI